MTVNRYWHIGDRCDPMRKDMRKVGDILEKYCEVRGDPRGCDAHTFTLRSDSIDIAKDGSIKVPLFEIIDAMFDAKYRREKLK